MASPDVEHPGFGFDDEIVTIGGLPIAVTDRAHAAEEICRIAVARRGVGGRPAFVTSANGQVLVLCDRDPAVKSLFAAADLIHADGMPMVFASRILGRRPLPERVATTDLVHDVMALAPRMGIRSFLLGASDVVVTRALAKLRELYPDCPELAGHHGYFGEAGEAAVIDRINAFAPDVLWVGLGVPLEQAFVRRNLDRLTGVGVVKTAGGLFDFLAGVYSRAPLFLQRFGMEWAWRAMLEPRRLVPRYFDTNFAAMWLLLTRTGRS